MPKGVTKQKFNNIKKYYDPEIFCAEFRPRPHTTQRHAYVLAPSGLAIDCPSGPRPPRRPHQTQDRRLDLVDALLHSKVFKDAVLDLIETKVVFVQAPLGVDQIMLILVFLAQGKAVSTSM